MHQHPALLPDMTVSENIRVAVAREHLEPRSQHGSQCDRSSAMSTSPGISRIVFRRSASRSDHLLELAKAFAVSPRLLILDEPTAPLSRDSVELLFGAVRRLAWTALPSSTSHTGWPRFGRSPIA